MGYLDQFKLIKSVRIQESAFNGRDPQGDLDSLVRVRDSVRCRLIACIANDAASLRDDIIVEGVAQLENGPEITELCGCRNPSRWVWLRAI